MATMVSEAALALNFPRRHVRQRAVVQVGEELLDDRVAAVLFLGVDQLVMAGVKTT